MNEKTDINYEWRTNPRQLSLYTDRYHVFVLFFFQCIKIHSRKLLLSQKLVSVSVKVTVLYKHCESMHLSSTNNQKAQFCLSVFTHSDSSRKSTRIT